MNQIENLTRQNNHAGRVMLWIALTLGTLAITLVGILGVLRGLPGGGGGALLLQPAATQTPNYPLTATALIAQATASPGAFMTANPVTEGGSLLGLEGTATAESALTPQAAPESCSWGSEISGANPALLGRLQAVGVPDVTVIIEYPCGRSAAGLPVFTALHITLRVGQVADEAALGDLAGMVLAALANDPVTARDTLNLTFSDGQMQIIYWRVSLAAALDAYQQGRRGADLLASLNTLQAGSR